MPLLALALLAWTHVGWSLFLRVVLAAGGARAGRLERSDPGPVTVIVAAYAEETVIAATVRALRAQTLKAEIIVACDGSPDATAERAREAGADVVLELPRSGKHAAQARAVERASGALLAFCDANTVWAPDALAALRGAFLSDEVGYACGHVEFVRLEGGTNQEGAYWALELATRRDESAWHSVTAGNGGIYAVRAALWPQLRTDLGHDLALPHQVVRAGFRAVDVADARASETMVPSVEGEWRRKRRMMARMWGIVARDPRAGGLLDPRGLPPRYLFALVSHRWLRYASPGLHVVALVGGLRRVSADARPRGGRSSAFSLNRLALTAQLAVLAGAAAARPALRERGCESHVVPTETTASHPSRVVGGLRRVALLCRYYVLMTASIAAGGGDRLRHGPPEAGWSPPEGTR